MRPLKTLFFCLAVAAITYACQSDDPTPDSATIANTRDLPVPAFEDPGYFGRPSFPTDNPQTEAGVKLGRMLFYDRRLSADDRVSCASCHHQDKAFTDGRAVSTGIRGQQGLVSSMSLQNLVWSNRLFWDGRSTSLEDQALEAIENPIEMDLPIADMEQKLSALPEYESLFADAFGSNEITGKKVSQAIAQFVRTMVTKDSKFDKSKRGEATLTAQEKRGETLFYTHPEPGIVRGGNCGDCHLGSSTAGSNFDFDGFHNNGLDALPKDGLFATTGLAQDQGKFKAPTLRNIALTAPYMHDGRFTTLEEVLDHYNEHIQESPTLDPLIIEGRNGLRYQGDPILLGLTDQEKEDIIAFLHTLTDTKFTTNEAFANPFIEGPPPLR